MPISDDIESTALTLRFKHGKQTILLFAQPLTPFTSLKEELLVVLRERYPKGLDTKSDGGRSPVKIPDTIKDVRLGVPKDQFDWTKGWTELDTDESPKSLGVKDGGMLAFVFEAEIPAHANADDLFNVEFSNVEELDEDVEPQSS